MKSRHRSSTVFALQVHPAMPTQEHVDGVRGRTAERYVALCLWVIVAVMFFSLASQWVLRSSYDRQFTEDVQGVLQRSATENRSPKDVRSLILIKADQLSIPLQFERVNVQREGDNLRAVIDYDAEIRIPVIGNVVYRMQFNHDLRNRIIQF